MLSIYFYYFSIISPLGRTWPFICTNLNPLHPGYFVPSLVEIGPFVVEKKMNCEKLMGGLIDGQTDGRTYGRTDDDGQVITKAYLSFQEEKIF